jgi:hypothetical protein
MRIRSHIVVPVILVGLITLVSFELSADDIPADARVPVLVVEGVEICYYFLEEQRLREHLQAQT